MRFSIRAPVRRDAPSRGIQIRDSDEIGELRQTKDFSRHELIVAGESRNKIVRTMRKTNAATTSNLTRTSLPQVGRRGNAKTEQSVTKEFVQRSLPLET